MPRFASLFIAFSLALTSLVAFSTITAGAAQAKDLNCDDFPNQAAAQRNLDANPSDPNGLDADDDGEACETSLSCPCGSTPSTPAKPKSAPAPKQSKPQPLRVVKVIDGELLRVRQGDGRPYVVHMLGVSVPKSSCEKKTAKRDLRTNLKVGTVVLAVTDNKAPNRDKQGNLLRFVGIQTKKGAISIGLTQIARGFADADRSINYTYKGKYKRVDKAATKQALGYHGSCA